MCIVHSMLNKTQTSLDRISFNEFKRFSYIMFYRWWGLIIFDAHFSS